MTEIVFRAPEYQPDQSFVEQDYRYIGSVDEGWLIERNNQPYLELGAGYVPVQTSACGICSTDLARHRLPFALPQITGHELSGLYQGHPVAIEINASHQARGVDVDNCPYCAHGLDIHCPERVTLGIDRLPGGFSPWVLAPVNAIHRLPQTMSMSAATLIEPFAAALKAVTVTSPREGDQVAVLGPRKLGMLLIAALSRYREKKEIDFSITAVMRHANYQSLVKQLGADAVQLIEGDHAGLPSLFDIVFDTTGSPQGFSLAVQMTRREVHIKSTHGQPVAGLNHLTSMVINEHDITELNADQLQQQITKDGPVKRAYLSPDIQLSTELISLLENYEQVDALDNESQFDLAIVNHCAEIDALTRPVSLQGAARLKAAGRILLSPAFKDKHASPLLEKIATGQLKLTTSRCGHFSNAIELLAQAPELVSVLESNMITHVMPATEINQAFELARHSKQSIKVVVETAG